MWRLLTTMLFIESAAIVSFTLFQGLVRNGIADVTLNNAGLIIIKVFGIGFGSVGLAAVVCFTSAFLLKQADPVLQQYPSYEISIVLLSAYLSYVIADLVGMSGIVALFFSGVLMSHYHLYNIADESATALRHLLTTSSFLAENFVFIYMGMSVVAPVLRYFGLTATQEQEREFDEYVNCEQGVEMFYWCTNVIGTLLSSEGAHERLLSDDEEHDADTSFRPIDRSLSRRNISGIHGVWERLDEKYLKPLFGGRPRDQQEQSEPTAAELKRKVVVSSSSPKNHSRKPKDEQNPALAPPNSSSPRMSLAEVAENHDNAENVV
ncbi:unnamed protein product [Phytophthora fragariaefolia]|uniref:Unnamed protein product n=1 Tax=Phytophthora fragariaefolia TaxID=1490495 RepID=A0A9W6TVE2_9STRA|nr:unnamed protein product [Phytophthora fragariaefolia]